LTLTAVTLLAPHLTPENHAEILDAVRGRSKREIEAIVAGLHARPDVPASVRKLPAPKPATPSSASAVAADRAALAARASPQPLLAAVPILVPRPAVVLPLAPARYKVQLTIGEETQAKLRRVQDLMRHQVPNGDLAVIFDRALTVLLADLERTKLAATTRPRVSKGTRRANTPAADAPTPVVSRPPSAETAAAADDRPRAPTPARHIPAAVKREVWRRDGGQCSFVGTAGRCAERGFLEFHHLVPYAAGGEPTVENIFLRCKAHNLHEAERYFEAGPGRSGATTCARPVAVANSVRTELATLPHDA
jgi:5-methylcytosine-specific restriction endonuclease McrA